MFIEKKISKLDPSRYIVYQMIDSIRDILNIKIVQEEKDNLFLFKTEPFIDSLYNFAHILNEDFSANDLGAINAFFGDSAYRIKSLDSENINKLLLDNGFKLKNSSYGMVIDNLDERNFDYTLEDNIKIKYSDTENILKDIKSVFVDAFDYVESDYDRKFGFLDKFRLNSDDNKINAYVIYENGEAVSTAAFYAYDKFSIENVGTIKSARGKGYAALMLKFILNEAKKLGYNEACLVSSEAALSVYKKLGFKEIIKNNTYTK
jgi:ribosomal protein S18 acetylase RimI-like enzyme